MPESLQELIARWRQGASRWPQLHSWQVFRLCAAELEAALAAVAPGGLEQLVTPDTLDLLAKNRDLLDLLRAFEPGVSSRIPNPREVLQKIRALEAALPLPAGRETPETHEDKRLWGWARFNETTGSLSWDRRSAADHPDRCVCQGNDFTPHKHHGDTRNHACARCFCKGYQPAHVSKQAGETPLQDGWQEIATAPKDGRVLLFNPDEGGSHWSVQTGAWNDDASQWMYDCDMEALRPAYSAAHQPTHWQPLPSIARVASPTQEPTA
jgi:hypothetical protein